MTANDLKLHDALEDLLRQLRAANNSHFMPYVDTEEVNQDVTAGGRALSNAIAFYDRARLRLKGVRVI